ncbi:DNA-binding response regulator, partial [Pseudomonas sp. ATCC 13867]
MRWGYVCKRSPLGVLSEAMQRVRRGDTFIDPTLRQPR